MRALAAAIFAIILAITANGCGQMPVAPRNEVAFSFLVTNPDGNAIEGAQVYLRAIRFLPGAFAETGADGRAQFQLLPGDYDAFLEPPEGNGLPDYTKVPSIRISKSGQEYQYSYGGFRVSGTMTAPNGSPIDSGRVSLLPADPNDYSYTAAYFHGGQFRLWVPAGTYRLVARSDPYPSPYPPVVIPSMAISHDSTLVLACSGHKITGHVSGPDGSPLPNVYIIPSNDIGSGSIGLTDAAGDYVQYLASGNYRWEILPDDPYRYILPRNYPIAPVSGPATFDFALTGTSWSGTLRDAGTSAPIAGYIVQAHLADGDYRTAYSETDGAGGFHLELESGRDYDLLVGLRGQWPFATFRMPIAGADSTFDLLVNPSAAMTRGATLGAPLKLPARSLERTAVPGSWPTPVPRAARAAAR